MLTGSVTWRREQMHASLWLPWRQVVCVEDGLPTWVCELMVTKPTIDEAIAVGAPWKHCVLPEYSQGEHSTHVLGDSGSMLCPAGQQQPS